MARKVWSGLASCFAFCAVFLVAVQPPDALAVSGKTRVAVVDFEQKGAPEFQGKQAGEIVAEWLITALVKTGRFEVVERAQLQKILKEQQLGMSGVVNQETAAKVGELLGVKVIVTGAVIQFGSTLDVNARLISVEDGSILKAERLRAGNLESVEGLMAGLADSMKRDFPMEGYVVMVSGKRAMIDLGRIHGVEGGMRFSAFRKGAPVRHPITGKMLKGEDIKIGEMNARTIEQDTCWADIVQEEPGVKIAAGNVAKAGSEETTAAALPSLPMALSPSSAPPAAAAPAIAKPAPAMLPARPWTGKIRSVRTLVDWAGTNDLLLGDRDGFVILYLNQGTKDAPRYDAGVKVKSNGKEIKVKSPSSPCLTDWNGDGKADLLVGDGGGYLHLYLNQGTNENPPNFGPEMMVLAGGKNVDAGGRATPTVTDWNEDGKKDLLLGNGSGEVFLYVNKGANELPVFDKPIKLNGGSLDVGSDSALDVFDWNGDGRKDLIIGNSDGEIFLFPNKGPNHDPQYDSKGELLPLKLGPSIAPLVIPRDRGKNDLVVADRNGEVTWAINSGNPGKAQFMEKKVLRTGKR